MTAPRLKEKYTNEIVAKLEKDLALDNVNKAVSYTHLTLPTNREV